MDRIDAIADRMAGDWRARAPYARLEGELKPAGMDEAYAAQEALYRRLAAERGPIAGRKIALASRAMQEMVGISSPVAGAIFSHDIRQTPAEVARAGFRGLGLEYELAIEIGRDVAPGDGPFDATNVRPLIAAVRPAFELIEDRGADYADLCALTLTADNAWCGGIVLGEAIDGWEGLDLADLPAVLTQDGVAPEHGNTGAADPLGSLAWVLDHVTGRGATVRAGEQIITGSILRTRFPAPGGRLRYEVGGRWAVEIAVT